MFKRPRDAFDTPDSSSPPVPANKRRYLSSSVSGSSPSASSTRLSTPYTLPYFRSPFSDSVPHDSPSNPFGLNRALRALTLPRPTGFSKHIVLRMQLVSTVGPPGTRSRRALPQEAPYRIVQVPLNFSFRLLHMLLLFLFASDARLRVRRKKRVVNRDLRARQSVTPSHNARSGLTKTGGTEDRQHGDGHLFEVFEDIKLYANSYRPGVIKAGSGRLYVRLSSAREGKLFPDAPSQSKDEDVFGTTPEGEPSGDMNEKGDSDEDGWDWEAEDDFLLSNVWMDGPNLRKGVIYYHTPSTAIHITVNQGRVPPRKGIGNVPYVFSAHGARPGAVLMSNVVATSVAALTSNATNTDAKGKAKHQRQRQPKPKPKQRDWLDSTDSEDPSSASGSGWDSDDQSTNAPRPFDYESIGDEVPELGPFEDADETALERWNGHNAFDRFLKREAARERTVRRHAPASSSIAAGGQAGPSTPSGARRLMEGVRTRARARRELEEDVPPSSPIAPRDHRYGHRRYATRAAGLDVDPDADADADGLPPSSPSTLPIELPSDCDALWTDTDHDSGNSGAENAGEHDRGDEGHEDGAARENQRYMIELPLQTPFPAQPTLRRRVRRASERMEQQVSKGLCEMSGDEEDEGSTAAADATAKASAKKGKGKGVGSRTEATKRGSKAHTDLRAHAPAEAGSDDSGRQAASGTNEQQPPSSREAEPDLEPEPEEESGSGSGSDEGSVESVEIGNFPAPWLRMRGPQRSRSRGSGWDSDEV
ncbi:hypothetical protein C8Q77DRAFT_1072267 [Trametes polyzona]|nr:hypothetical protein C8Q77DRAFT_1072267 [Trametes polyzona]